MINILKITLISVAVVFVTNCSQVLQTVDLKINIEDSSAQEEFGFGFYWVL